jgi:hypothetical protein
MGLGEDGPVLASLRDEVIMKAGSRVNDYISRLADWQQAGCQHVRQLVHDADPEVEETIKRSVLPYRMHDSPAWLAWRFTPRGRPEPTMQRHAKSVCIELAGWQLVSEPPAQ